MAASLYFFESRAWQRRLWGALFLLFIAAQVANQSRGAILQLLSGILFVFWVSYRWGRAHAPEMMRARLRGLSGAMVVAAVIVMAVAGPAIVHVSHRFTAEGSSDAFTLKTRAFLWTSAFRVFLAHPIIGVGPAQALSLVSYRPELHFETVEPLARGLGIHNSVLAYLAESGIVGSILLAMLLWRALSLGRGIIRGVPDPIEAGWHVGLWGMVFVIVTRYLYEGHLFWSISGMTTATFIAMLHNIRRAPANANVPAS